MAIVLYSVAGAGLLLAIFSGLVLRDILLSIPVLALVAYCGYWLFWFPVVTVSEQDVTVVNPGRTVTVPWADLRSIGTKYSLTLETTAGKCSAWAAPAPSAVSRKSPDTEAVLSVRAAWTAAKAARTNPGTDAPVRSTINWLQLAIPLGLIAVVVLTALFVR